MIVSVIWNFERLRSLMFYKTELGCFQPKLLVISQAYANLVFGMFRKSLDMAVEMQFLEANISKRVKAIPKGKVVVPSWAKEDFKK